MTTGTHRRPARAWTRGEQSVADEGVARFGGIDIVSAQHGVVGLMRVLARAGPARHPLQLGPPDHGRHRHAGGSQPYRIPHTQSDHRPGG